MDICKECISSFILKNGNIIKIDLDCNVIVSDSYIYEIFRVIDSTPLFIEDYYQRLQKSLSIQNTSFNISLYDLLKSITELIAEINLKNGNLKIVVDAENGTISNIYIYQIQHNYPEEKLYFEGIKVISYNAERINPNAKQNQPVRQTANEILKLRDAFEIIYVNNNNLVTEGSRTNVFFVKNNEIFTAPKELVLEGVTRKYVIEAIYKSGFKFIEKNILLSDISFFDAGFITGTSPKILPISCFDDITFNPQNECIKKISLEFNNIYLEYIEKRLTKNK